MIFYCYCKQSAVIWFSGVVKLLDAHVHFSPASSVDSWINQVRPPWSVSDLSLSFAGLHPWFIPEDESPDAVLLLLESFLTENNYSGVGECGLDINSRVSMILQEEVLLRQLIMAGDLKRPLSLHCLKAWDRLIFHLSHISSKTSVMVHSFHSSGQIAGTLLDLDCYLSFSPGQLLNGNARMEKVFQELPADRLLLESDAPDSHWFHNNGAFTEVSYKESLARLYKKAASLRHIETEEMIGIIGHNGKVFKDRAFNRNR